MYNGLFSFIPLTLGNILNYIRPSYICRAPKDPPNTTMVFPMTEEEWPAMGGGPCVVTMQFHL